MSEQETVNILENGCLLCRERDPKPLFVKAGKRFVRCRQCGLIYQDPPPLAEESREYYEKGYYESLGSRVASIQETRLPLYKKFLSESRGRRQTGRLLDVGSGYGDFLRMAQEEGWEAWGIDPSREASESARKVLGSRILNQTIEAVDFPENHFDVITLWNVIDCLSNPAEALQKVYRWLRPGGLLLLRTPNAFFHWQVYRFYSRFRSWLEKMGWAKEPSVFLRTNFDGRTLARLLRETGFGEIRIQNGEPTQGDAYQVFSHAALMTIGKSLVYGFGRLGGFLSGHRLLIGSSLVAQASKEISDSPFNHGAIRVRTLLKRVILHLLALIGYLLGLPWWFKVLGKKREIRILRYHSVNEFRKSDVNVRASQFVKQLDFLRRCYSVISLEEAVDSLKKGELPRRGSVALTFDDGYEDNYTVAYPLLKERGLAATIFVLAVEDGKEQGLPHMKDSQPQDSRRLRWDEVREMAASRMTFGSHGETHSHLIRLTRQKAREEIVSSRKTIERETGRPVRFFSYPYGTPGDFDETTESFVQEAGYEAAFSAIFGTNGTRVNPYSLRRIGIEASDTLFTFQAKLNGALSLLSLFDWPPLRNAIRWFDSIFLRRKSLQEKKNPLLLVTVDFPPHLNGVSTVSRELSQRIAQQGKKLLIIGPADRGDREFDQSQPYRVFRVPGYDWGYLRFIPILLCMPWVILRYGIQKVFAMNIAYGGLLSWLLSFFVPLEYLIFAYGYEFEKVKTIPWVRALYLRIYRRAKAVVACSEGVRERLIRFGVAPEKIKVLYPAVDLERYRPVEIPRSYLEEKGLSDRKIILTVGRLIERKGHDQVLAALPRIRGHFPDVLYCIVGAGSYEKKLREQVKLLGLEPNVRFFGKVSEEELLFLYNACRVFIMPSREIPEEGHVEGFGIVYLEASACGKPVIGGRSGGVLEALRDGETGFLVAPHDPAEITEKINLLLSEPARAQAMGLKGLEWVRRAFRWDRYAEECRRCLDGRF